MSTMPATAIRICLFIIAYFGLAAVGFIPRQSFCHASPTADVRSQRPSLQCSSDSSVWGVHPKLNSMAAIPPGTGWARHGGQWGEHPIGLHPMEKVVSFQLV